MDKTPASQALDVLQAEIDAAYQRDCTNLNNMRTMMRRLGSLPESIPETAPVEPEAPAARKKAKAAPKAAGGRSSRDEVFKAIADWATLEAIKKATGLTEHQIRGVLNSKQWKQHITKRDGEKGTEYKVQD